MTLLDFVSSLGTQNVNVVVVDGTTEQTLIEFKSQGYAAVENEISARNVKKWTVGSTMNVVNVTVVLEATI